jgi:hypothetical protein
MLKIKKYLLHVRLLIPYSNALVALHREEGKGLLHFFLLLSKPQLNDDEKEEAFGFK